MLVTLCLVYSLNFLDRQFLSVVAEPVKRDLQLSDTQLGLLTGLSFAILYTLFGIPIAHFADRGNRVRIVSAACATWSVFTAGCALATGFSSLALARVGVGLGEAGGTPPSYSIISDYFPPERRAFAFSVYSLGIPIGLMLGAGAGGLLADFFGWRTAFLALGILGLLVAPAMLWLVKEPVRGRMDPPAASGETITLGPAELARHIATTPVLVLVAISTSLCAFVGYAILSWTPAYLIRHHGMSLRDIALYYSLVLGASVAIGTWASGWLIDRYVRRGTSVYALVPGVSFLAAVVFLIGFVCAPTWPVALAMFSGLAILTSTYLPSAITIWQNAVPCSNRATAGSILLFLVNLIGLGGGPLFVGGLSDWLAAEGVTNPLGWALGGLAPVCLLACIGYLWAGRHLARDPGPPGWQ